MFNENEFTDGCRILEEQDTFKMLPNSPQVNTPMEIRVLSVDQTLLRNVAPTMDDLPLPSACFTGKSEGQGTLWVG